MSYSHAAPRSRLGVGGFSHFPLVLVLLAIVGSTLVVMASHAARRHGEEFVKAVSSQCMRATISIISIVKAMIAMLICVSWKSLALYSPSKTLILRKFKSGKVIL